MGVEDGIVPDADLLLAAVTGNADDDDDMQLMQVDGLHTRCQGRSNDDGTSNDVARTCRWQSSFCNLVSSPAFEFLLSRMEIL